MSNQQHGAAGQPGKTAPNRSASLSLGVLALMLGVLLIAASLRLHHLSTQSLWNDEGNAYVQALRSFPEIAANAARDIHPPGYYMLLAVWRSVTGTSEFALRALSTFASVLTVALAYAIGRRLFSTAAGLSAAAIVALNTFSLYYAQEARMYALLALWGAAGMWVLSLQLTVGSQQSKIKWQWVVALGLINAAGLYTQYAYPFVMLAQGVIVVVWIIVMWARRALTLRTVLFPVLGMFVLANLLAIVLYLPWLPTAIHQLTTWPNTGQPMSTGEALAVIGGWFTFGLTYNDISNAAGFVPLILLLLTVGVGGWLLSARRGGWRVLVPLLWAGLPVLLFLALGLFRPANLKLLLPSQVGYALWLGAGLGYWWQLGRWGYLPRLFASLLTLWLLSYAVNGLAPLYDDPRYQRADYRSMVAAITAQPRPGDAVVLDAPNQEEVFRYYYHAEAPVYPLPPGLGGDDTHTLDTVRQIIAEHDRIFVLFWGEAERDPNHVVESTLDAETFQAGEDHWYGDVRLVIYEAPAEMPPATTIDARFGAHITLVEAALNASSFRAGDVLQTAFTWRTDAALADEPPYKVFVQVLNESGTLVAQRDAEPASGSHPTPTWQPGEPITDRHGVTLPADLPPGTYTVIVGLYNAYDPAQRLPVENQDYLTLGIIQIVP